MYSDEIKKKEPTEIQISPLSKWKRILLYLGDMMISFILAVLLMNVVVMPIYSLFNKVDAKRVEEANTIRNEILYENKLLFYRDDLAGNYAKNNFDGNLIYTFDRFLAFYIFEDDQSLNPTFPEYSHRLDNEIIWTYYHDIRGDYLTYYDIFSKSLSDTDYFIINETIIETSAPLITLKDDIKDTLKVHYMPGEELGKTGKKYYEDISDIFSALFGCVIQDIYANDLMDSNGHSFNEYQAIIELVSKNYYTSLAICGGISYVLSWFCVRFLYPLINKDRRSPTMSIMRVDRLGYDTLAPIDKKETLLMSAYYFAFDMPYLAFLSLSYTTFIYSLSIPVLPLLTIISILLVIVSLLFIVFNYFNRSFVDIISKTVMVPTEDVDMIIKAKEELEEYKKNKKGKING